MSLPREVSVDAVLELCGGHLLTPRRKCAVGCGGIRWLKGEIRHYAGVIPRIPLPPELALSPFTHREGLDAGLGKSRLRGSDLHASFRGVRTLGPPRDLAQLAHAFQTRAADNIFFCSITAARLMGVPLPWRIEGGSEIHVAVPAPARSPRTVGVIGHKFEIGSDDIRDWHGLRITTPERTWCDLAPILDVASLVAAGDYIIHWESPLASKGGLESALARHPGRRGKGKRYRAITLLNDRSESAQESFLRVIVVQGGIQGVKANLPIRTSGGYRYRADLAIPERMFILEYQSRFHDHTVEFRSDMTRTSRLEADGWHVMQVNRDDLDNPRELLQRIRRVLQTRR